MPKRPFDFSQAFWLLGIRNDWSFLWSFLVRLEGFRRGFQSMKIWRRRDATKWGNKLLIVTKRYLWGILQSMKITNSLFVQSLFYLTKTIRIRTWKGQNLRDHLGPAFVMTQESPNHIWTYTPKSLFNLTTWVLQNHYKQQKLLPPKQSGIPWSIHHRPILNPRCYNLSPKIFDVLIRSQ